MEPAEGRTNPLTAFRQVDLPLPFAPSSATASPWRTERSTPSSTCLFAYPAFEPRRPTSNASGMAEIGLQHVAIGTDFRGVPSATLRP